MIETAPLLRHSQTEPLPASYGTSSSQSLKPSKRKIISHLFPLHARDENASSLAGVQEDTELSDEGVVDFPADHGLQSGDTSNGKEDGDLMAEQENESDYLKSKLWCVFISL